MFVDPQARWVNAGNLKKKYLNFHSQINFPFGAISKSEQNHSLLSDD